MASTLNINYQELKSFISNDKTEEVLAVLKEKLQSKPPYTDYLNEVIILSGNLTKLNSARRIDILNLQHYTTKVNQINSALLELLDDLKDGKALNPNLENIQLPPYWKIAAPFLIGITILASILGAVTYYFLTKNAPPPSTPSAIDWSCPSFDDNVFEVLVLPFHDELPEGRTAPHKQIVKRLNEYCQEENLAAQVGRIQPDETIKAISDESEARNYTTKCQPDMLVWGLANMLKENTAITINYSILNKTGLGRISDFSPEGTLDTLLQAAYFSSTFEGATFQIETVLKKLLKTMVAFNQRDYPAVVAKSVASGEDPLVPSAVDTSKEAVYIAYVKAESHIHLKEVEDAINEYTKVLEVEPTEVLALNNRAHLNFRKKRLDKALVDLNTIETLGKADYEIYYKKAEIHEYLGNLGAAKKDFAKAKAMSPTQMQRTINSNLKQVEKKIQLEKTRIIPEINPVPVDPNSISENTSTFINQTTKDIQLNTRLEQAELKNDIGNIKAAASTSIDILSKDPTNKRAIRTLIKAKYFQNGAITLKELQQTPQLKNIDLLQLKRFNDPICNIIIRNELLAQKKSNR